MQSVSSRRTSGGGGFAYIELWEFKVTVKVFWRRKVPRLNPVRFRENRRFVKISTELSA
jgi:hypothetical protein